jgi:splicing factor 3A subunit 1
MPDKPEWRLDGRMLSVLLPLTDSVAVAKSKIHEETGLPPGKQKLSQDVSQHSTLIISSFFFLKLEFCLVSELTEAVVFSLFRCQGLFFKDSNSLAYYNVAPGSVVQLGLKERGGRKK